MSKPTRVKYQEGDWFAVPLKNGKFALGLVARKGRRGVTLGYFFGPARDKPPADEHIVGLRPENAVLIGQFGDLGIIIGEWPLIHRSTTWDRAAWPLPAFARISLDHQRAWRVELSEDDLHTSQELEALPQEVAHLPRDGLYGSGAMEKHLTKLLSQ